jgi:hypothetical protein
MVSEEISGTIDEKVENAVSGEIENKIGEYFEDTRIIWEP